MYFIIPYDKRYHDKSWFVILIIWFSIHVPCLINHYLDFAWLDFFSEEKINLKNLKKALKPIDEKLFKIRGTIAENDLRTKEQHMADIMLKGKDNIRVEIIHHGEENDVSYIHSLTLYIVQGIFQTPLYGRLYNLPSSCLKK